MPLSGLMENTDYAGFLYANFRAPLSAALCSLSKNSAIK
jgi:hypothetical protein